MNPEHRQNPGIPEITASVIVCTYNRSESIKSTIDCLGKQDLADSVNLEVIIVDNNSTDETKKVVQIAQKSFPNVKYTFEEKQGLSHARNHGINNAQGDIIIFTDDDVCPEPDWVKEILLGMNTYECDACGGYIAPTWETTPPSWLTEIFYGFLAIKTEEGNPHIITTGAGLPFGANMAFKRRVFDDVGFFDISRGRKGNVLASGEDGELFLRLLKNHHRIVYLPQARVHHKIESYRVKKSYFRRWRFQTSLNIAQQNGIHGTNRFFGIPLYLFTQTLRAFIRAITGKFTLPADEAFYQELIVCHFLGTISGLFRTWRENQPVDTNTVA